jgi:lysyl-tRNA synthetase class 1
MAQSAVKPEETLSEGAWASALADKVLAAFPNEALYTCAAGISPSGVVHFGNFRDVVTSFAVMKELQARGKQARLLFSWDDFDRFRKVPVDVDQGFVKYIGMALTAVPDPWGKTESYAAHFEAEFEASMQELGIALDYRYQTRQYKAAAYAQQIATALQKRDRIAEILLSFKTEKGNQEKGIDPETFRATFYPVTIYSRFTGKDKTEVLEYDGGTKLTYKCLISGETETIDFSGPDDALIKLQWKIDWPMRWGVEKVHFEPGGKDHASPGGSYDVSQVLAREIFGVTPPVFQGYEFVGIQGGAGKMSGSKGGAVSPAMLLDIYEPSLLKWLYLRRAPTQSFNLAFDTEVYRQYDEFDRAIVSWEKGEASPVGAKVLEISGAEKASAPPIPFKQAVALGQITQWNAEKLAALLEKLSVSYDFASIERRLVKARNWLERYNPEEILRLRDAPDRAYAGTMDEQGRLYVSQLCAYLEGNPSSVAEIEEKVYAIPKQSGLTDKELKAAQRRFFKDVYMLLVGKDTGPRLSTFLWAVDRGKILQLLNIA